MSFINKKVQKIDRIFFFLTILLSLIPLSVNAGGSGSTFTKTFIPDTIGPGGISTLRFDINNTSGTPAEQLTFTDILPEGVSIASPANATSTCGEFAILTAPNAGSTITFTDGRVAGSASCVITVDVTSAAIGVHNNISSNLTSSAGTGSTAIDDLNVVTTLPGFSKSFAPNSITLGGRSILTFTIDNTLNASRVGNLDFTDNLPAGMVVANPSNASTDCISASAPDTTLTAIPGTNVITLNADGSTIFAGFEVLPVGATCTVSVDVTATGIGILDNVTSELLADFTTSGKASDTLNVSVTPLALQKSFTDDPTPPGGSTTLEFIITNFDRNFSATSIAFTDDLTTLVPAIAGLTHSSLLSNDCGGSISGVGTTTIDFSGGTLSPESSCTIRVSLQISAGATPGTYTNTTSTVTTTIDDSSVVGNVASDQLFVAPVPVLTKEFLEVGTLAPNPVVNAGDDVVLRFTITNTSTTSGATAIAFIDELTNGGPGTGFLPFPVSAVLPGSACGGGMTLAFIDTDRQGLALTGGNLTAAPGAGSSCTIDVTLTIPVDMPPSTYLNTTGVITATVDGATRTGKTASDTLSITAAPTLNMAFTDSPVAPGNIATLEFTLTHSANASADATGITFTNDLTTIIPVLTGLTANLPPTPDPPCGPGSTLTGSAGDSLLTLMGGNLMPGDSCTFSVTLDVPMGTASGSYTNTTSGVSATVAALPVTSAPTNATLNVGGMIFTKEFIGDPAFPGKALKLRFALENISSVTATGIGFTDSLFSVAGLIATDPALADDCGGTLTVLTIPMVGSFLTYAGGSLPAGLTCNIDVEVTVPLTASDGVFENFVSGVSYMLGATPGSDGPAIDNLTVDSDQLSLSKAFTDDPVAPGGSVSLEFTLTNLDPDQTASAIDFSDDLGATLIGLTFDSVLFNDCGATISGTGTDMITVTGASLNAEGSCTIRTSLSIPAVAAADIYSNTTSAVTGMVGGFAVSGDTASDNLEIINLLQFSKSFNDPTTAARTAQLTFTITNPGANSATGIAFSDNLDDVISGLVATNLPAQPCGQGSSITGTSFLAFTGGELPPMGGMCSFDVDVLVPATATVGDFINTTSDLLQNGLPVSTPATANLTIEPPPVFSKVFAPDIVGLTGPNTVSTLTFTIDNTASSLAASVLDFTDNLPASMQVSNPANASTTCNGGTLTATASTSIVSYTGGSVAASASCTTQIDVIGTTPGALVNTSGDLTSTSGNSGTASDTLTVDGPPVITPPVNINTEATGPTTAVVLGTATVTDDITMGLTATPDNMGPFPVGSTIVIWTATDISGNTGTANQTITIVDTTAPIISLTGANPFTLRTGDIFTDPGATATDLVDGIVTGSINSTGTVNTSIPATYTITYSVTDAAGNTGMATRSVIVNDGIPPVVTPPTNINQEAAGPTTAVSLGTATVTDDVDTGLTATPSTTGPFPVGITTVTWVATDNAGNVGSAAQTVTIVDTTSPIVTVVGNNPVMLNIDDTFTDEGAAATDLVDGDLSASISVTNPVNTAVAGEYLVRYSATDNAGNTGIASRTVLVEMQAQTRRTFSATLPSGATGTLSFSSSDPSCTFSADPIFINVSTATIAPLLTLDFVDGLISFDIENCTVGATVNISMDYGQPIASNTSFWKQGNPWFALASTVSGNTINFQITDGGVGDSDGIANGSISDPGGAAVNNATNTPTQAIPTLSEWALLLMSLLMLGMTVLSRRNIN